MKMRSCIGYRIRVKVTDKKEDRCRGTAAPFRWCQMTALRGGGF
jgi:hypothetical protein